MAQSSTWFSYSNGQYCAAINCHNCRRKRRDLSFFRFPKDKERCMKWVQNTKRADLLLKQPDYLFKNCVLCAEHFEISQFMNQVKKKSLIWKAIPTLFDEVNRRDKVTRKRPVSPVHTTKRPAVIPNCEDKDGDTQPADNVDDVNDGSGVLESFNEVILTDVVTRKHPLPSARCDTLIPKCEIKQGDIGDDTQHAENEGNFKDGSHVLESFSEIILADVITRKHPLQSVRFDAVIPECEIKQEANEEDTHPTSLKDFINSSHFPVPSLDKKVEILEAKAEKQRKLIHALRMQVRRLKDKLQLAQGKASNTTKVPSHRQEQRKLAELKNFMSQYLSETQLQFIMTQLRKSMKEKQHTM